MAGIYAGCNLPGRSCCHDRGVAGVPSNLFRRFGYLLVKLKQFRLRLAKRTGLPSEIASALWQKGVHIQAFIVEIEEEEDIFHLAVDKAAVAKQTFVENGWRATEECVQL